jgi:mycofactocin precursor
VSTEATLVAGPDTTAAADPQDEVLEEVLVAEISIDGMCGVY